MRVCVHAYVADVCVVVSVSLCFCVRLCESVCVSASMHVLTCVHMSVWCVSECKGAVYDVLNCRMIGYFQGPFLDTLKNPSLHFLKAFSANVAYKNKPIHSTIIHIGFVLNRDTWFL